MRVRFAVGVLLSILLASAGGTAKAQALPVEHQYDVVVNVSNAPMRGSRFVFGLVNGDTRSDNYVRAR